MIRMWVGVVGLLWAASAWADDDPDPEPTEPPDVPDVPADQPPLTSGGLYTLDTYPTREPERPLTMTRGVTQLAVGIGADLSNKTAFESAGASGEARYGYDDNATIFGGLSLAYNARAFEVHGGFEGALAWDVVDVKLGARMGRAAYADQADANGNPTHYRAEGLQASIDVGFPLRYTPRPEVSIVALDTLIAIDLLVAKRGDPANRTAGLDESCFAMAHDDKNCVENGRKPDLLPSLAVAVAPIAQLSLVTQVQLQIRDFDNTNQLTVPATIRARITPWQRYDLGLEVKVLDLKNQHFDSRFLSAFVQARF